jgi:5'-nucleotidase (lipoprotein e(P4) family)
LKKLFLLFFILVSCASNKPNTIREYQLGAYLWYQNSGEFQALCYQAFNLARMRLDQDLELKHNKKRAVIFDIDETVFDNSIAGAYEVKNDIPWEKENLNKWVKLKKARAIAGAVEFIDYAVDKRVEIFYVSNRTLDQIDDTFINLKSLNIPAKKENLLFMDKEWSKESRRKEIQRKYEVVLYFGDNLHDFDKTWDSKISSERKKNVDIRRYDFGDKYIILPNPLYGDWENTLPKTSDRTENLIINP